MISRPPKTVFDPGALSAKDRYKLLIGTIVPRPIGWIGTRGLDGIANLAPYSLFNMVAGSPPTVLFVPGRTERVKDSLANVLETGEFTVNIVTEETATAMNATSAEFEAQVDEFEVAGLTPVPGEVVSAPMVAEAKANLECQATQFVDVGPGPSATVVFGEVVRIHVATAALDGTRVDPEVLGAVGRLAGADYTRVRDGLFRMDRPTLP